jgi:hypothetical protein
LASLSVPPGFLEQSVRSCFAAAAFFKHIPCSFKEIIRSDTRAADFNVSELRRDGRYLVGIDSVSISA